MWRNVYRIGGKQMEELMKELVESSGLMYDLSEQMEELQEIKEQQAKDEQLKEGMLISFGILSVLLFISTALLVIYYRKDLKEKLRKFIERYKK